VTAAAGETRSPKPGAGGFTPLFNGNDLLGWRTNPALPAPWTVANGAIRSTSNGRYYTNRNDYRNFHLRAELKVDPECVGGILFRSTLGTRMEDNYAVRINTLSDASDHGRTGSLVVSYHDKELQKTIGSVETDRVRPGDWFTLEVIAVANRFEVRLSDQKVTEAVDAENTYTQG